MCSPEVGSNVNALKCVLMPFESIYILKILNEKYMHLTKFKYFSKTMGYTFTKTVYYVSSLLHFYLLCLSVKC